MRTTAHPSSPMSKFLQTSSLCLIKSIWITQVYFGIIWYKGHLKNIVKINQVKPSVVACTYDPRTAQGQPRLIRSRPVWATECALN